MNAYANKVLHKVNNGHPNVKEKLLYYFEIIFCLYFLNHTQKDKAVFICSSTCNDVA